MAINLHNFAKKNGVKYFFVSFVDLFGVLRSKLVPATAIDEIQSEGAGFAGFATWLDMSPADSDMFGMPDGDSVIQLPWNKEIAWVASDLYMDEKPVEASPRIALKRQIEKASSMGLYMKSGVECEFFLVNQDGTALSDDRDTQEKPCYDSSALMRRYDVITEICDSMIALGWKPYQNDHEDANGQFEMNWDFTNCLVTADRHAFFKFMTKTIAEKHSLRATFMPKPLSNDNGSGMHCHQSIWSNGKPVFYADSGYANLSDEANFYIGGLLKHAPSLLAFTNPTINSFKRLVPGYEAPVKLAYSNRNRSAICRIPAYSPSPKAKRVEVRCPDATANPYLAFSAMVMAGLDGIKNRIDPGEPMDKNLYDLPPEEQAKVKEVPSSLEEAVNNLEANHDYLLEGNVFTKDLIESYIEYKREEEIEPNKLLVTPKEYDLYYDY